MNVAEYNKCVDEFSDSVYRFIVKNIKNTDKARDIVQDAFEKLWRNKDNVDGSKVKSYLFTTAYHTMIDYIRKDKRTDILQPANIKLHAHNEQYSDLHEVLNKAINLLPPDQRSVILLRDYEGYSYDEIAKITGLSEAQVKVYIYRGRNFLKNYIGSIESVA